MTSATGAVPQTAEEVAAAVSAFLGITVEPAADAAGTPCLDVPRERWVEAARFVRDTLGMDFLDWLSAVDQPDGEPAGVDVVLHVAHSHPSGQLGSGQPGSGQPGPDRPGSGQPGPDGVRRVRRMLLRTRVPESDFQLPSLTEVWPGVAWHERETFEMFGVGFADFTDGTPFGLRPLLLPDGFEGNPLRKSFVLAARASKPWPGAKEPGESDTHAAPARRKVQPPGVPDPITWGPRDPNAPPPPPRAEAPERPARGRRPVAGRPAEGRPVERRPAEGPPVEGGPVERRPRADAAAEGPAAEGAAPAAAEGTSGESTDD